MSKVAISGNTSGTGVFTAQTQAYIDECLAVKAKYPK